MPGDQGYRGAPGSPGSQGPVGFSVSQTDTIEISLYCFDNFIKLVSMILKRLYIQLLILLLILKL